MKILYISIICFSLSSLVLRAQTDIIRYFESYFETTADRSQWTNVPSDNNKNWIFNSKGGYINSSDGLNYNPDAAFEGTYNAFHVWSDFNPDIRRIVSVPIDLSDAKKPELFFAHAMYESVFGSNKLMVLFRAGSTAPWDTIINYNTPINNWTTHTINIKDYGTKYLCKDFQLAFESRAEGEFGVCIDNVVIEEKDIILRYVKSLRVRHVSQNPLPSGCTDLPVMRLDIQIAGNTDPIILSSLVVSSLSTHDSLFASGGFELVATRDSTFRTVSKGVSLRIGSPVSISSGNINFTNINFNLPTGYNAIWLMADVKNTAPHNSIADFKVKAGDVQIGTNTYPASEVSPAGHNTIEESVFYDSFEGSNVWILDPDFEAAVPKGYIAFITRDPDCAYTGTKCLGTDLSTDGKYRFNITEANAYYATTPSINLKYYNDVKLSFKKMIGFEGNDHGVIEVSNDDGASWNKVWDSKIDALTPDNEWTSYVNTDVFNSLAAHKQAVKIRFGIISSDNNFAYSGFNIDNFAVTGNYLTNDVGIVEINAPVDDCHDPGSDSVEITVRNYADRETGATIPVFFSIDGSESNKVTEYIPGPIPKDGTAIFKFSHPANFPSPGNYSSFTVKLQVTGDEDATNDTRIANIFIQKSINPPHYENFETEGGYWKSYGTDPRWLCKLPEGSIPALYGKSWISSPYGNYLTSDTAFLESSCYNLVSDDQLILEMKLWLDSEPGKDGASVEYSNNNGISWNLLPAHTYPWNWNWYNDSVSALGTRGWSGISSANWKTVKQVLPPELYNDPKVKFRIKWASDEENTYRGMALDDARVYSAPPDLGIALIDSFGNRCQNLNPDEVTVVVKNLGINALRQNDTIIVGYDFNHSHMEIDTFKLTVNLMPGETVKHTFTEKVDVSTPGNYNITAYTLSEKDPWFYTENNDTLSLDFEVYPGPLTTLQDTILTHIPDTVVLNTLFHADYDYWWNGTAGTNVYNVKKDGWQYLKVTATRGNGCSSFDSTNVEILVYDLGVSKLLNPASGCGNGVKEQAYIEIKNFGNDSIAGGQKIAVGCMMNSGEPVIDTVVLLNTLYPRQTLNFMITDTVFDVIEKGVYSFKVFTSYGGDTLLLNDTLNTSIEILGRPAVSLGPDVTVEALEHTIDAGGGYESYTWDNETHEQTRVVTESGWYWVQVYDQNGCDNSDTAYVRLKIRDISTGGFVSPVSDCNYSSATPVIVRINNTGTDTIPTGTQVSLSYIFNSGLRVSDNMTLLQALLPGQSTSFDFSAEVDLSQSGDYPIESTAITAGDLRTGNDTLVSMVYRYNRPVADFGLSATEYIEDVSYDLEAGYGEYYTYQWQDTATTHLYRVTKDGLYHVKVTDPRTQCYDRDTVRIFLIYGDVGITWSDMPQEGCTGDFEGIKVRVTNLGPSSIGSSAPIYVACDINGQRMVIDTLTRGVSFNPGSSLELILSEGIGVRDQGISRLTFYTLYSEDKKTQNDTLAVMFDALSAPVIDFGDDNGNLQVELPYVLDAGSGQKSYLWQDNSTAQTFTVNTSGTYTVKVTGQNDCQAEKTVRINLQSGTNDRFEGELLIYPNPSQGLFRVRMKEYREECIISIFDSHGNAVYNSKINAADEPDPEIDLQHLPRGIYHLVIRGGSTVLTGKILVE